MKKKALTSMWFIIIGAFIAILVGGLYLVVTGKTQAITTGKLFGTCEDKGYQCVLSGRECARNEEISFKKCDPNHWRKVIDRDPSILEKYRAQLGDKLTGNSKLDILVLAEELCPRQETQVLKKDHCRCCVPEGQLLEMLT